MIAGLQHNTGSTTSQAHLQHFRVPASHNLSILHGANNMALVHVYMAPAAVQLSAPVSCLEAGRMPQHVTAQGFIAVKCAAVRADADHLSFE